MAAMSVRLHPPSCCSPRGERLGHPFPDEVAMDRRIRSNMIHFLKNFRCARVLGAMRGEAARQARSPTQQRLRERNERNCPDSLHSAAIFWNI